MVERRGEDSSYPYVWAWRKWPLSSWESGGGERYGQRCRVLLRSRGGSAVMKVWSTDHHVYRKLFAPHNILVEFEDGTKMVALKYSVRLV